LTSFGTDEECNQLGMAYVKPVGILTNAACYSSCDLFAAAAQDNGAAIIFGEDGTTGAGGANVIEHESFLVELDGKDFESLPYAKLLKETGAAQGMRVGWRQQVRILKNQGKLIEDTGVISDFIVRPTPYDMLPDARQSSQFETIAEKLSDVGRVDGRETMACKWFYHLVTWLNLTVVMCT
jgi:C-terminal processing protease CtpA/Prc